MASSTTPAIPAAWRRLADLLAPSRVTVALSGAGLSTASGIPDYRSPGRPTYTPLQHGAFISSPGVRARYWARSALGFGRLSGASPNAAHAALAALEHGGYLAGVVTQNVDRLHQRAGTTRLIELHGTVHEVECLSCGVWRGSRADVQAAIERENASWMGEWRAAAAARPDGDVELPPSAVEAFRIPACPHCGAVHLKPRVVFHGGSVPAEVTVAAAALTATADTLLVLGTTLTTFSAFRLVRDAAARGAAVVIVNQGVTRGDGLATLRIDGHTSEVLRAVAAEVLGRAGEGGAGVGFAIERGRGEGAAAVSAAHLR